MIAFFVYAAKRLLIILPFLIGLSIISFLLGIIAPGDPALTLLTMDGSTEPTVEDLAAMRHLLGLDQPIWQQYLNWLIHALKGDFGISYLTQKPVLAEILRRFPVTFHLSVWAMAWVLFLGIPFGVWSARYKTNFYIAFYISSQLLVSNHFYVDFFRGTSHIAIKWIWRHNSYDNALLCFGGRYDSGRNTITTNDNYICIGKTFYSDFTR